MAERSGRTAASGTDGVPLIKATRFQSWRSQRQRDRRAREVAAAVRQMPFPLYGLPADWECGRSITGSSYGAKTGLGAVRLGHRIGNGRKPVDVNVTTARLHRGAVADQKEGIEYEVGLRSDDDEALGELEWMRMRIPVDGASIEFEVIAGRAGEWGAVGTVGEVAVAVEVRNFAMADVVLEKIPDVEPYVRGRRAR